MRTLVMILGLAGGAWAQDRIGQEKFPPAKGQKLKPKDPAAPEVGFQGGLELRYDDNILEFNRKQLRQLEDGTRPEKFRIKDSEDLVWSPWVELEVKARLIQEPTRFGLRLQPHAYHENSIASYEEYRLFAKQPLGKHEAGIEYALEWDRYLRELEIGDSGLWESAFSTDHELECFHRHRIAGWMTLRGTVGVALRDFESPFEYRDQRGYFLELRPGFEPAPGWKLFAGFRYKSMESAADSTQEDTSYDQHELELGASAEFFEKRLELVLRHRVGFREYTSGNSPVVDPSHVDREDERTRTMFQVRVRITRDWTVEAGIARWVVTSDRPFDTGDTDEAVGSRRQTFTIGASFSF